MKIQHTGRIAEGFYTLGLAAVPVCLLDGPNPALFDAGFASLAPLYAEEIKAILGERPPSFLFLTHAHWDHLGAAGYFKTLWPGMTITGPAGIQETLDRPNALEAIETLNRQAAQDLRLWDDTLSYDAPFRPFALDHVIGPGQRITLARECHVEAVPTPGHTREHTSYWIPERRILVASEAVGDERAGRIIPEFLVDYDAYRESLKTLISLQPEILCLAHDLAFTGPDALAFMKRSLKETDAFVGRVENLLLETGGDIDETVARIKSFQYDDLPYPKQPVPAYLLNTGARVRHLWQRMKRRERRRREESREGRGDVGGKDVRDRPDRTGQD